MALDFYKLDDNEYLCGLDDEKFDRLSEIFQKFTHWTRLVIDQYENQILTTENQRTLIKIIDGYISAADLNKDRQKTREIIEFGALLKFYIENEIDLKLVGD